MTFAKDDVQMKAVGTELCIPSADEDSEKAGVTAAAIADMQSRHDSWQAEEKSVVKVLEILEAGIQVVEKLHDTKMKQYVAHDLVLRLEVEKDLVVPALDSWSRLLEVGRVL